MRKKGGYAYAKEFFREAYNLAIKEAGGEQYILSAVMHADERNKAVSEQLGKEVYHYHLHVVYVPVVDKEVKWSKRCKDPALVGTTKEIIKQVSHSKKWPREMQYDENGEVVRNSKGKAVLLNSYSLLQDRFFEHMQEAGFTDFERGDQKSAAVHLDTLEYKIQQDKKAIAKLEKSIVEKQKQSAELGGKLEKGQAQLAQLGKKIKVDKQSVATHLEIDSMAKRNVFGKMELSPENWKTTSDLAKEGVVNHARLSETKEKLAKVQKDAKEYKQAFNRLFEETKDFLEVKKRFPEKIKDFFSSLLQQNKDKKREKKQQHKREQGHER